MQNWSRRRHEELFFLRSIIRLSWEIKLSCEQNGALKNFFLTACRCWDARNSFRKKDQKINSGWTIAYGNPYLWSLKFDTPKYLDFIQKDMTLLKLCDHKMVMVLPTVTRLGGDQIHVSLVTWLNYFLQLRKTVSAFYRQPCQIFKQ